MSELNVIYNEDCLITMKDHIEEKTVDLVMTSPPYNMTKRKGGFADTGRYDVYTDWKTEDDYIDFTLDVFKGFDRILIDKGVVLYNFSYSIENPSLPYKLVNSIERNSSFTLVDTIMWKKNSGLPFPANARRLTRVWEFIFVFVKKGNENTFNAYKEVSSVSEKTGQTYYKNYTNIVEAKNNDSATRDLNQATYSTELCLKLFSIYGNKGLTVYDPFMGTGTTASACVEYEMNYIGSELSEKQCEYANNRINTIKNKLF